MPDIPRVALVIPVYCERPSLPELLQELFSQPYSFHLEVVVVDDNSPDGTADAVRSLQADHQGLRLLERERPEGRGAAVIEAFRGLLDRGDGSSPTIIAEMDGDGSHDPVYLAPMVEAMSAADVVLGSRYVEGGGAELSGRRRFLSTLANSFSRLILGLPYRDCSSGYRCYSPEVLSSLGLETIGTGGHATHLEMLLRLHRSGAKITEVPMVYRVRKGGESKVTLGEVLRVAWVLLKVRLSGAAGSGDHPG